jgi:hypothetical protein
VPWPVSFASSPASLVDVLSLHASDTSGVQHPMYDDIQIRIRIDAEGYTHATIVEWDEDGHERTYTADENFCTATLPTEAL